MQEVARRFCRRRAGSSILFVGDSTQGQLFQSFASILGANRSRRRVTVTEDEASWAGANAWCNPNEAQTEDGRYYHQLESVCPADDVTLRFVRNDLSVLDERQTTKRNQFSLRSFNSTAMCDWSDAARAGRVCPYVDVLPQKRPLRERVRVPCVLLTADLIVFNRGAHYVDDESFLAGLHDTMSRLSTLLRTGGRTLTKSVVYRSTLAAIPNCSHQPRDPAPTSLHDLIVANGSAHHWDEFEHQNQVIAAHSGRCLRLETACQCAAHAAETTIALAAHAVGKARDGATWGAVPQHLPPFELPSRRAPTRVWSQMP